ncbi:MAG TPA: class I SAM-dependent methyltransferase [Candidatus Limnocylindrales bacterium]|jgi:SAM-dependent methyltransferase
MVRTDDPVSIVAAGYDRIADRYLEWSALRPSPARRSALGLADELIPAGAVVLELGCGAGIPMTARLAAGRRLTGIDLSIGQIDRARRNVPDATFEVADMTTWQAASASLDAVVAFYSLTHVPRDRQAELFAHVRAWLRPGGVFIASLGVEDDPGGVEEDWLGVPMYFSHFSARVNRRLLVEAGFVVERAEVVVEPEDRHDARFLWVVARVPDG